MSVGARETRVAVTGVHLRFLIFRVAATANRENVST